MKSDKLTRRQVLGATVLGLPAIPVVVETAMAQAKPAAGALPLLNPSEPAAKALGERGTVIRQAVGTRDDTRGLNQAFHERLLEVGIAHAYHEVPDAGHDARAVLTALSATDPDFYHRALGSPAAGAPGDGAADGAVDPPADRGAAGGRGSRMMPRP